MKKNRRIFKEHSHLQIHRPNKKIKFNLDQNKSNAVTKENEPDNLHSPILEQRKRKSSLKKKKPAKPINNIENKDLDKDFLKEFKEKNNINKEINGKKELEKIYEDNDIEDEFIEQPLMKVHRMSMRKKELGKIRNDLKKNNEQKSETIEPVSINKSKAEHMAQNFFKKRLKYFNQEKKNGINTEGNDNNINDYGINRLKKRHFNNTLSENLELKTDFSQDNDQEKDSFLHNINNNPFRNNALRKRKRLKRLHTDILSDINSKEDKYFSSNEKNKDNSKIKDIDKDKEKELKIEIEELKINEEENPIDKYKKKENEEKKKKEDMKKQIPQPIFNQKKEYRKKFKLNLEKINNLTNDSNNISNSNFMEETNINKTIQTTRPLNSSHSRNVVARPNLYSKHIMGMTSDLGIPPIAINKILRTEKEIKKENEEKSNLSHRGFRRKFAKKEDNEEPKLVYKAVIRVNKRVSDNNITSPITNNENKVIKEEPEKKIEVIRETREEDNNKIKKEENIRSRYRRKGNKEDENKTIEIEIKQEIVTETTDINDVKDVKKNIKDVKRDLRDFKRNNFGHEEPKTVSSSFSKRRFYKKI